MTIQGSIPDVGRIVQVNKMCPKFQTQKINIKKTKQFQLNDKKNSTSKNTFQQKIQNI